MNTMERLAKHIKASDELVQACEDILDSSDEPFDDLFKALVAYREATE